LALVLRLLLLMLLLVAEGQEWCAEEVADGDAQTVMEEEDSRQQDHYTTRCVM